MSAAIRPSGVPLSHSFANLWRDCRGLSVMVFAPGNEHIELLRHCGRGDFPAADHHQSEQDSPARVPTGISVVFPALLAGY